MTMADNRQILTDKLEHQLGTLVSRVEIAIRNNLSSSNVVAETTLAGLLNLVYGWHLVNANAISQNYPGVDLIDQERSIAVQVTSSRTTKKVRHTLEEVAKLDTTFSRLILLIITNQAVTPDMKTCAGTMELWNIPDVFRSAKELDTGQLQKVVAYLEAELGLSGEVPHLELPLSSRLQTSGFVGRQSELEQIRGRYARGDKLVVLTGLGGIGKTELSIHYGLEHPGKVYFTRFDTSFTHTLANMAQGIRPRLSDDVLREEDSALCNRVLELLKKADSEDLLIIDNADSEKGILADLQQDPGYAALTGIPMKLLLTTRSDTPRAIPVETMPDAALIQIFQNHNVQLTDQEMMELIRAVNSHTMTIDLIARTLTRKGWKKVSAADILTALKENTLSSQKYREITTDYNQSPEQAQIYTHLSAVFNVSGVPEKSKAVLSCATLLPDGGMDTECFGSSLDGDGQEALDALLDRGWLEIRNDLLTIHPVIRLVCRTEIPPTDEGCDAFLIGLIEQYDEKYYQKDRYRQMAELLTNASRFLTDTNGTCAGWAGSLWLALGNFMQALECELQAMKKMEESLSPDHADLATIYSNVGGTYGNLGDHRTALEYQEKAMEISEKALAPDHPDLATSYNNVGLAYSNVGDHKTALKYQKKALDIRKKVLAPNHPDLAKSYNNVGSASGNLGDHRTALEYQKKAMEIREQILPSDHPDLATSYNNMGYTYGNLGDHRTALKYVKKAMEIREKVLLPDHPALATSYNNVGNTYGYLGDHRAALEYMTKALDIRKKVLPQDHHELAQSFNNVGSIYCNLGDHKTALEYQKKALAIWEKALSPDQPTLAISCHNIAWTYHTMGQLQDAARYMRRAAEIISRSSLPEDHPDRVNYPQLADRFEKEARMQQAMMAMASGTVMPPFALPRNPKPGKRKK